MMDQINDILSNMSQEDMNQIKSLADSLLGGNFNGQPQNQNTQPNDNQNNNQNNNQPNFNQFDNNQNNNTDQNSYQQNNDFQSNNNQNYQQNNNQSSGDNIGDLFGSLDPAMLAKIGSIMGKLNSKKDDDRIKLIRALMPLLSDKRQKRAEKAMKFIGLYELLPEIKNLNLF